MRPCEDKHDHFDDNVGKNLISIKTHTLFSCLDPGPEIGWVSTKYFPTLTATSGLTHVQNSRYCHTLPRLRHSMQRKEGTISLFRLVTHQDPSRKSSGCPTPTIFITFHVQEKKSWKSLSFFFHHPSFAR